MALNWSLSLRDGLSGPAGKAARSTESLAKSLDQTAKAADKTDRALKKMGTGSGPSLDKMTRRSSVSMTGFGKAVQFVGRHVGSVGVSAMMKAGGAIDKYGESAQKAMSAIGGVASAAGGLATTFAAIGGGLMLGGAAIGAQVAMHVRSIQAFKESTLFAFTKILGTREEAQRIYDMAAKTSFEVGADLKTSISGMNSLLAKGFKADFADELIRRMADLSTLNPSANIEALIYNIGKIRSQGRLQGDELQALSEAGLNVADVYAEIAKSMKLTQKPGQSLEEQVLALQAAGKIKSDIAIPAIMEAIKKASGGGAAGAVAAEKASKSPEGMMMKLLNLKDQLLSSIVIDWSPITRGIDHLMGAMKSDAGQRFFKALGDAISGIVGKLDKISQKDMEAMFDKATIGLEKFASAMGAIIDLTIALGPVFSVAFGAVTLGFDTIKVGADLVVAAIDRITAALERASLVGQALSGNFGAMMALASQQGQATAGPGGAAVGGAMGDGIISGLLSKGGGINAAISALTGGMVGGAMSDLGINSPSKVFRDIFKSVPEGAAQGVERGAPAVASATTQMSSAATNVGNGAVRGLHSIVNNDNSGGSKNVTNNIVINESKDARSTGREVSAAVMAKAG